MSNSSGYSVTYLHCKACESIAIECKTVVDPVSSSDLEIGSVPRRECQATTYEVELEDDGFNWEDKN